MKRRKFVLGAGSMVAAAGLAGPWIARAQPVDKSKLSKTMRFSSYGGSGRKA